MKPKKASILWTGGKDSVLALYDSVSMGYEPVNLVTFAPIGREFRAHPLECMARQAEALGLPQVIIETKEPYKQSYTNAIGSLKENYGIDILVTGDISEVDGHPNWIRECSEESCMEVCTPLWHCDRTALLKRLISSGFKVIFSCVKCPWFTEDWVGRVLDLPTIELLSQKAAETGLDRCGENGEYHTLVLDGPPFTKSINVESSSICREGSMMYLDIHNIRFGNKGCVR